MSTAPESAPAKPTSVTFAGTTAVQHPDGTTSQQPINPPTPVASTENDTDNMPACSCAPQAAAAAAPPSGPPGGPPAPPAPAAAAAPEPNGGRASSGATPAAAPAPAAPAAAAAPPGGDLPPQRIVSYIQPPIGPQFATAMNQPPPYIMMGSASQTTNPQPFLWVNPPMVAPSISAPPPNTFGSWCYPSQTHSPFWAGASANRTAIPPSFYTAERTFIAQDAYLTEPEYVVSGAPTTIQIPSQIPSQVHYYVNGSTGPFVYYT